MSNDPTWTATRDVVDESIGELRKAVAELTVDQLNTRPVGEDSNPLGVIVVHALASTRSWTALATGAPLPPRDRPSEFLTVVRSTDELLATIDSQREAILGLLDAAGPYDPERTGVATWMSGSEDAPVTAAWALQHALAHLGEHVGHAHMTHDLFTRS